MVVAFRRHTLLPLDDCLYALQPSIPHLTRSARFDMICEVNDIEHRLPPKGRSHSQGACQMATPPRSNASRSPAGLSGGAGDSPLVA